MTISINEGIGKAHVLSYTFWEFLKEVQELTAQGYELCLENQYFPNQYSGRWEAYFDAPAESSIPETLMVDSQDVDVKVVISFTNPASGEESQPSVEVVGFAEGEVPQAEVDAALEELVGIGQDLETPAEVVNNQDAETANEIPVAVAEAPESEEDKPRRGRPKLTRNE